MSEKPPAECDLTCPECGAAMRLKKSKYGLFYSCSMFPACRASHGAHPDGRPLGRPGTAEEKVARVCAHEAFDTMYKGPNAPKSKSAAYQWMERVMDLTPEECHIGLFDMDACEELMRMVAEFHRGGRVTRRKTTSHEEQWRAQYAAARRQSR
jgi:ssDNA-binding Zn-finger/Zn-ribbon topoisomerase 1